MEIQQLWWEHVPGAFTYMDDIIDRLLDKKSLVIDSRCALPWYDYMVDHIKTQVQQRAGQEDFKDAANVDNPGDYLLHRLCKPEKVNEYRPIKSHAQFLAESDDIILHSLYLWIKISSAEQLKAWSSFASEYIKCRGAKEKRASFILEWFGEEPAKSGDSLKVFCFDRHISDYDKMVFCMLASSTAANGSLALRNYLMEIAINLTGHDIELCAACLRYSNQLMENPYTAISRVVNQERRSDGTEFAFDLDENAVDRLVWRAQIKAIYPLIENYREHFVTAYSAQIKDALPYTCRYGNKEITFREPAEVEIGILKQFIDTGKIKLPEAEKNKLNKFYDARNALSHIKTMTYRDVDMLTRM